MKKGLHDFQNEVLVVSRGKPEFHVLPSAHGKLNA